MIDQAKRERYTRRLAEIAGQIAAVNAELGRIPVAWRVTDYG